MSCSAIVVTRNGRRFRAKFLGKRLSWVILSRNNRTCYYPIDQLRRVILVK